MNSHPNASTKNDYLFPTFEDDWGKLAYLCLIIIFSCAPLVMLCICAIRFCLGERDWELEAARQEHHQNVRRLVVGTSRLLGQHAASRMGDSKDSLDSSN